MKKNKIDYFYTTPKDEIKRIKERVDFLDHGGCTKTLRRINHITDFYPHRYCTCMPKKTLLSSGIGGENPWS